MEIVQELIRGVIHSLRNRNYKRVIEGSKGHITGKNPGYAPDTTPRVRFNIRQLEFAEFKLVQTLDSIFQLGKEEIEIAICGMHSNKTLCSSVLDRQHFYTSEAYLKYFPSGSQK